MAQVRRLAAALLLVALAGCGGSSSPEPPSGGDSLRLALPLVPRTLDPAKVVDLSSVNVAHELYAGLTRFSGNGVEPDLAESWEHDERGLVWTFHLRDDLRWSDDRPLTAEDFRRSWLRALSPELGSAYARAEMQNIAGARRYRVTGTGDVGVEAVDERTLRVTLAHPVPWLDEQVAWPVFFPVPDGGKATSGPFRLAERSAKRLVLERNFNYWNVNAVKPKRLELTAEAESADAILPRGIAAPGFHWIETGGNAPPPARGLAVAATGLLWFVTRGTPLAKRHTREYVAWVLTHLDLGVPPVSLIPDEIPGASFINSHRVVSLHTASPPLTLSLSYTTQDRASVAVVGQLRRLAPQLRQFSLTVVPKPVPTLRELLGLAGPPAQPGVELVLLGWSSEFFDAYNILDLFPCGSAFNVAQWCDRSYDRGMARAVRTLDDRERWRIERQLVERVHDALPAIGIYSPSDSVVLRPGVGGFSWSPIGNDELMGMTRS
jgi:ABC-type oligopeptide transport system substrate-binding subunit